MFLPGGAVAAGREIRRRERRRARPAWQACRRCVLIVSWTWRGLPVAGWCYPERCEHGHEWRPSRVLVVGALPLRPDEGGAPGPGSLGSPDSHVPGPGVPVGVVLTPARPGTAQRGQGPGP